MEYKEITRKNGTKIVFCNFEELLKEAYGVTTMEEVEQHASGNEYIIHCPFCKAEGHTKHKLYVKTDLTVSFCFVCCRTYVNTTSRVKTEVYIPSVFANFGMGQPKFEAPVMTDPNFTLDMFKYEFDDFDEKGYKYLLGRHGFFKDLYRALNFRFWNGNVVIPFMHDEEPYYYQIRFTGQNKIKYYLPKIQPHKPVYMIERNDDEDCRHRILIVEGVFDAIAALIQCPDYTPVAVLGSSISDYQISQIRDYAGYVSEVRIWMDETDISKRIADKVKTYLDYCPMSIIKSYGPDPEEILQKRLKYGQEIQWIRSSQALKKEEETRRELENIERYGDEENKVEQAEIKHGMGEV